MQLDPHLVDEVAEALIEGAGVPFPGGHGVLFPEVRERHFLAGREPGTAPRCYIALALLGSTDLKENWNRKEWLPHAAPWFMVHRPELLGALDAPAWRYLLAGMHQVTRHWARERDARAFLIAEIDACYRTACERLAAMTRRVGEPDIHGAGLAEPMLEPMGDRLERDWRWHRAAEELGGARAEQTQMMYFMHALHASLGVSQPSLDEVYSTRRVFYARLKAILEQCGVADCSLCTAARGIGDALGMTGVLNSTSAQRVHFGRLSADLPACFRPAHHHSRPPQAALVSHWLNGTPLARDRLVQAHALAEAVSDLIMDPVRAARHDVASLSASDYSYLLSLARYGEKKYATDRLSGALLDEDGENRVSGGIRPMSKSFAERMSSGLLVNQIRGRLAHIVAEPLPMSAAHMVQCSLCVAPARSQGR